MTKFMTRIVIMSVTLLLFCTVVMAQNNSDINKNNVNYGVKFTNNSVKLKSGNEKEITFTLLEGFKNPIMICPNEKSLDFNDREIKGNYFSARITKNGENYSLVIKAKEGIKKAVTEKFHIRAMKIKPDRKQKISPQTKSDYGIPIEISISPK